MPFILIFFAIIVILVGINGTGSQFIALVESDFTGQGNYFYWLLSIMVVGSIGYIKKLKTISDGLLLLILLTLFIKNGSFFSNLQNALSTTTSDTVTTPTTTATISTTPATTTTTTTPATTTTTPSTSGAATIGNQIGAGIGATDYGGGSTDGYGLDDDGEPSSGGADTTGASVT